LQGQFPHFCLPCTCTFSRTVTFSSCLIACDNIYQESTCSKVFFALQPCVYCVPAANLFVCIVFKVGSTRKLIAVAYGQKGGKQNVAILQKLVSSICPTASLTS
jgi:hypothetical protein